jgi:hypothetical protein
LLAKPWPQAGLAQKVRGSSYAEVSEQLATMRWDPDEELRLS